MEKFGPEYNGVKVLKLEVDEDGDSRIKFMEGER